MSSQSPASDFVVNINGNSNESKLVLNSSYGAINEDDNNESNNNNSLNLLDITENINKIGYSLDSFIPNNLDTLKMIKDEDISYTKELIKKQFIDNPIDIADEGLIQSEWGFVKGFNAKGESKGFVVGNMKNWNNEELVYNDDTLVPLASMGKLALGLVVGAMVDKGIIYPNTSIHQFIPDWNPKANKVKILRIVRFKFNKVLRLSIVSPSKAGFNFKL